MPAYRHHLVAVEHLAQVHEGNARPPCRMGGGEAVSRYEYISILVAFERYPVLFFHPLAYERDFCRHFLPQTRHGFGEFFQNDLDNFVQVVVVDVRQIVVVFLENADKVVIEYGNGNLRACLLLCQRDDAHAVVEADVALRDAGIVGKTLACVTAHEEHVTGFVFLSA